VQFKLKWTEVAAEQYAARRSAAEAAKKSRAKDRKSKSSKQEGLFKQVAGAVQKLTENPRHPGLNSHPYSDLEHPTDPQEKVWESYAQNDTPGAYRIFWSYGPKRGWLTIIAITPHP
jgi:hypothetical protein